MSALYGPAVEWHGDKAYARCADCGKVVQVNKRLGSLHVCVTPCEKAGRHLDVRERQRGPFWNRRTELYCARCERVVP